MNIINKLICYFLGHVWSITRDEDSHEEVIIFGREDGPRLRNRICSLVSHSCTRCGKFFCTYDFGEK